MYRHSVAANLSCLLISEGAEDEPYLDVWKRTKLILFNDYCQACPLEFVIIIYMLGS